MLSLSCPASGCGVSDDRKEVHSMFIDAYRTRFGFPTLVQGQIAVAADVRPGAGTSAWSPPD